MAGLAGRSAALDQLLEAQGVEICPDCGGTGVEPNRPIAVGSHRCERCKWKGYIPKPPRRIGAVDIEYEGGMFRLRVEGRELRNITEIKLHWKAGELPRFDIKMITTQGLVNFEEAGLEYEQQIMLTNPPGRRPES